MTLNVDFESLRENDAGPNSIDFQILFMAQSKFYISAQNVIEKIVNVEFPQLDTFGSTPNILPYFVAQSSDFGFSPSSFSTDWSSIIELVTENKLRFCSKEVCDVAKHTASKEAFLAYMAQSPIRTYVRLRLVTSVYQLFCLVEMKTTYMGETRVFQIGSLGVLFLDGLTLKIGQDCFERQSNVHDYSLPPLLTSMTLPAYVCPIPRMYAIRDDSTVVNVSQAFITQRMCHVYDLLLPINCPVSQ